MMAAALTVTPRKMKICKVCMKLYDPSVPWMVESHMHQGQGPEGKTKHD